MFWDVVHAKSTHFNISASVQADLPRGRVRGYGSNLGWALLLLTEEDAFALGEAIDLMTKCRSWWAVKRESATCSELQRLTWAKLACLFYFWDRKNNQTLIHAFLILHTYPKSFLNLQFLFFGLRKTMCPKCLSLKVHFLENVETFINKNCWQWGFHCSMPDF